jgi:putative transposase
LRDLVIDRPNQVWCADITYLPMRRGFLYLVAVMDWATRKVLAWRVSNTLEVEFCLEVLEEALGRFGTPEIFNTDQGSQFTSPRFTGLLQQAGVRISMDGRGRWMDCETISVVRGPDPWFGLTACPDVDLSVSGRHPAVERDVTL